MRATEWRTATPGDGSKDLLPLFETIVKHIPAPPGDPEGVLQIQVMNLDYSEFLGRIAIGRVFNGTLKARRGRGQIVKLDGRLTPTRITKLYTFRGLERDEAQAVPAGDLVAIAGVRASTSGKALRFGKPDAAGAPADRRAHACHDFHRHSSPLSGKDGTYLTSRDLRDRLQKNF